MSGPNRKARETTSELSDEPQKGLSGRSLLLILVKLLISSSLLYLLFRKTEIDFSEILRSLRWDYSCLALLLLLPQPLLVAVRWKTILEAMDVPFPFRPVLAVTYISVFFNNFLPASIGGDAMRVWYGRRRGYSGLTLLGSVFVDRLVALFALLLIVVLTLPFLGKLLASGQAHANVLIATAVGFAAVLALVGAAFLVENLSPKFSNWLNVATRPLRGILSLVKRRRYLPITLSLSLLVHFLSCLGFLFVALSVGQPFGLLEALVLVPPVMFIQIVPISIGGWGVREAAVVTALGFVGIAAADALAISVLFGLMLFAASLPGLLVWLAWRQS